VNSGTANNSLISIIIPTFNRARLLCETIQSILNQTISEIELIVVDDGSTDNTEIIVKSYLDDRIRYYNCGKIGDIAKLRNIGLSKVTGSYVAFCDDDDLWYSDKLETQLESLKNYNCVCSNADLIDDRSQLTGNKYFSNEFNKNVFGLDDLLRSNIVITSTVMMKKSILTAKFSEKNSTSSAEDYELWLKLAEKVNFHYSDSSLVKFRIHENTSTFNSSKESTLELSVIKIIRKYLLSPNLAVSNAALTSLTKKTIKFFGRALCQLRLKDIYEIFPFLFVVFSRFRSYTILWKLVFKR